MTKKLQNSTTGCCTVHKLKKVTMMMIRAHSFPRTVELQAELQNLLFSAEFWCCRRILQKLKSYRWLVRSPAW